jgi:hypothetical protein
MTINLPLLVGCSREGRRSIHVARYLHQRLARIEEITSPWLDLDDYNFPIMEERKMCHQASNQQKPPMIGSG